MSPIENKKLQYLRTILVKGLAYQEFCEFPCSIIRSYCDYWLQPGNWNQRQFTKVASSFCCRVKILSIPLYLEANLNKNPLDIVYQPSLAKVAKTFSSQTNISSDLKILFQTVIKRTLKKTTIYPNQGKPWPAKLNTLLFGLYLNREFM